MAVAKRQEREKPVKIEQRKVWGPEWGSQVKQTALLASPIYIGQAQGEEKKHIKEKPKLGCRPLSLLFSSIGLAYFHASRMYFPFSSVQSFSSVRLFATPWTAAGQASLSITNSWSSPKPMSIRLVMPSNHLIFCRPLLLLPSIFPLLSK